MTARDPFVDNPLLANTALPAFDCIKPEHIAQAIDVLVSRCDEAIAAAVDDATPVSYASLRHALEHPMQELQDAWSTIDHLNAVCDTPALRTAFAPAQAKITSFFSRIGSDLRLYRRYREVLAREGAQLTPTQRRALEIDVRDFQLSGAELVDADKAILAAIDLKSAELSHNFAMHVLDATDRFELWLTEDDVAGVPDDIKQAMRQAAAAAGRPNDYRCGLQATFVVPVLQFARSRAMRETIYRASITRASEFGPVEQDNGPVIAELLKFRQERASLLGYANFAEVSLVPKMAASPARVIGFLRDLGQRARPQALSELAELSNFASQELGIQKPQPWDVSYVGEQLRQRLFDFSDDQVRQYFQLDRVLATMFDIAGTLFDIAVKPDEAPTWHSTVRCWRIERAGELLGRFQYDPYARAGKRGGAWVSGARARWIRDDDSIRPALAFMVTNFSEPAQDKPALLTHRDVVTLFHEFGHALHFLLSRVDVLGVAGFGGVEWDAVELPSQLMENFAWDGAALKRMSAHVHTGESIPAPLVNRMQQARNFLGGLALLRHVEVALFDMCLHSQPSVALAQNGAQTILDEVRAEISVMPTIAENRFQAGFTHAFAGGYAAGYYSYLWADVLAADVWSIFEEGSNARQTAAYRYRTEVLERGGSRPMAENFRALMGRDPSVAALLRHLGLQGDEAWVG